MVVKLQNKIGVPQTSVPQKGALESLGEASGSLREALGSLGEALGSKLPRLPQGFLRLP